MNLPILWIAGPALIVLGALAILIKRQPWKGILVTLFVLALVASLALVGWRVRQRRTQTDPLEGGEVYTVSRGDIAEVIEATGNLSPAAHVPLVFSIPGTLAELHVTTGQEVLEREVLARLDTADLELQLAQAQASLDLALANRDKLLAGARPEDVQVAESSLSQATANAAELHVTLSTATEQARLSWVQAANALRDAQATYENIYWENRELEQEAKKWGREIPDARLDAEAQAWRAVENAEAAMEQARLSYEQALQREDTSLRAAQSQVTSAWANLERLENGPALEDIAVSEISVEQARLAYDQAKAQLAKATLVAPFDGIVATVLADLHNQVSAANPILILLDPSSYYVDVQVDEVDISQVAVGQEGRILLDALPEVELPAEVIEVALSSSATGQGVVTYRVRVQVNDLKGTPVRPDMTANVDIITRRATDVLVVPRRAVRLEEGQAYVERILPGDRLEQVPVELGLGDPFYIEIVSGLQEGDRVFVRGVVERNQIQRFFQGGPSGMP